MKLFDFDKEVKKEGYACICGVDEAGRGPLAGPVCAAAVILPDDIEIEGLNDSKKLSEKKRELLFDVIKEKAVSYAIAFGSVEEIEELNILEATFIAPAEPYFTLTSAYTKYSLPLETEFCAYIILVLYVSP